MNDFSLYVYFKSAGPKFSTNPKEASRMTKSEAHKLKNMLNERYGNIQNFVKCRIIREEHLEVVDVING